MWAAESISTSRVFLIFLALTILVPHTVHAQQCLLGDTIVKTQSSFKNIGGLVVGDIVVGFDSNGDIIQNRVEEIYSSQTNGYYILQTEELQVAVTGGHPFYIGGGLYKNVDTVNVGDYIYVLRGTALVKEKILSNKYVPAIVPVYNLHVSNGNNFFANNFAVHNKGGCFLASTIIETIGGFTQIDKVRAGDVLLGFDANNSRLENKVEEIFALRRGFYYILRTKLAEVAVTAEHPFYACSKIYKTTEQLSVGDCVYILSDGKLVEDRVIDKQRIEEEVTVYNLQVSGTNTFFANGFAVHNKNGGTGPETGTDTSGTSDSETDTDTETGGEATTGNTTTTTTTTTQPPEKTLTIEILETPTQILTRGDVVRFKIKLTDGIGGVVTGADAIVVSNFFSQTLFDDGQHADASSNDGVYAAELNKPILIYY